MEKDQNIFETASKKLGGIKSKKKLPIHSSVPQKKEHRDPEIAAMLKQIDDMKQDLERKFEVIRNKMGWSAEDVHEYLNNPKNFPPKEWEKIQQTKKALGDKVWAAIGTHLKPKPKTRENIAGERKGKTLGGRKKWIPMR